MSLDVDTLTGTIDTANGTAPAGDEFVIDRARNTWLVRHLTAGTPLHVLMTQAGLSTTAHLQDLLRFLPQAGGDPAAATRRMRNLDKQAVAARVKRLMDWMCAVLDPSEYVQPLDIKSKVLKEALRREATAEELARKQANLDHVVSEILAMPLRAVPRWLRRQYKGDISVDDTPLPLASRKPAGGEAGRLGRRRRVLPASFLGYAKPDKDGRRCVPARPRPATSTSPSGRPAATARPTTTTTSSGLLRRGRPTRPP